MYTHVERLILSRKNHFKICSLEVRHAFESQMSNQQLNQNTKTTHLRNLTKNQTPLSLTISKKPKNTTTNDQPLDDDHRPQQHTHTTSCTTAAANFI